MDVSVFTTLSPEDLKDIIKSCVKEELTIYFENHQVEQPNSNILTMKDLSKMLGVSKPTIIKWTKTGLLFAQRIGRRVYYKKDDVEKCLKNYRDGSILTEAKAKVALNRWKNF